MPPDYSLQEPRMRFSPPALLSLVLAPCFLMQIDISGCVPSGGSGGGDTTTFNLPPTVVITADVVRGIAPLTVQFSSVGSTDDGLIVNRLWNFADGQTSREISPRHTFVTTGQYTVRLTLTDDQGLSASRAIIIAVTDAPVAVLDVDRTSAESAPAIFSFDASRSSDPDGEIVDYRWDFGDGSREIIPVVVHTFASPGTYRVVLTVTDDVGVTGTDEVVVEVGIPRPRIQFRAPPTSVPALVVTPDATLWAHVVFDVEPNVPRMLRAGLDGDADPCEAQTVLYNFETGDYLRVLTGHTDRVRAVAWSPDGTQVITASEDLTLRLYRAADGQLLHNFTSNVGAITSVAFSPDGNFIVYGEDSGAVLVRAVEGGGFSHQLSSHTSQVNSVAYSPNGDQVLSGSDDRRAIIWNLNDDSIAQELAGHTAAVTAVAFSPEDATLVATGSVDRTARLWDSRTGGELVRLAPVEQDGQIVSGHTGSITALSFSPDGLLLATASDDGTAKLWNVAGGTELRTFTGHTGRVTSVTFSPDGSELITGGNDSTARIWNIATGAIVDILQPVRVVEESGTLVPTSLSCTSPVRDVAVAPDGATLAVGVGARNDIDLAPADITFTDLNLTVPTPLVLSDVPPSDQVYRLWAEVRTDRSAPARTYATTRVRVIDPYTPDIDEDFTPNIRLREANDFVGVLTAPVTQRQVFDLGDFQEGDRLNLNVLTLPGYGRDFEQDILSIQILDANLDLFAWLRGGNLLFDNNTRLTVTHLSQHYYAVVDSGDSLLVDVDRGAEVPAVQREQRVYLNFVGGTAISVGGLSPIDIPPFDANALNDSWGAGETTLIKQNIKNRLLADGLFGPYDVTIVTSDEGTAPLPPYITVYFGGMSTSYFGVTDYIDVRNSTLTGHALIATGTIAGEFLPGLSAAETGTTIGNVAAHLIGNLIGLFPTDETTDVMNLNADVTSSALEFTSGQLTGPELLNSPIGQQNAPQLLLELIGPRPE